MTCKAKSCWKVIDRNGKEYAKPTEIPREEQKRFPLSVFPQESYADLGLERCLRVYPHLQNTGGFFVAVIEKADEIDHKAVASEGELAIKRTPKPSRFFKAGENEFRHLNVITDPTLKNIYEFYGIVADKVRQSGLGFFVRSERDPIKSIIVVSAEAHGILSATVQEHREQNKKSVYNRSLKMVNAGVRAFEIYETNSHLDVLCPYRPLFESLSGFTSGDHYSCL